MRFKGTAEFYGLTLNYLKLCFQIQYLMSKRISFSSNFPTLNLEVHTLLSKIVPNFGRPHAVSIYNIQQLT